MKFFINLKIRTKLMICMTAGIVFILFVGYLGIDSMKSINADLGDLYANRFLPATDLGEIQSNLISAHSGILTALYAEDSAAAAKALETINNITEEDESIEKKYESAGLTEEEKDLFGQYRDIMNEYRPLRADMVKLLSENRKNEAASLSQKAVAYEESAVNILKSLIESSAKDAEAIKQQSDAEYRNARSKVALITLFVLLLFSIILIVVNQTIKSSAAKCLKFAKAVSEGDLTAELGLASKDEVGIIAQAFDKTVQKLKATISELIANADDAARSSQKLNQSVKEMAVKMQNIGASVNEIAAGMENTSSAAQKVSASGQEINASVEELSQQADSCSTSALEIEKRAAEIKEKVHKSRAASQTIYSKKKENILKVIEEGKVVEEIEQMAAIISNVASQTNLLALNAAIEAAAAGEHGKGFAVVAEEVRKLAEQSSSTVKSIQTVIKRVEHAFQDFADESQDILDFINGDITDDYNFFENVGVQYKKDSVFLYELTQQLSSGLQEIAASVEETAKSIEEVSASGEEVSASSEEIAASLSEITGAMADITAAAENQSVMSKKLDTLAKQFTI